MHQTLRDPGRYVVDPLAPHVCFLTWLSTGENIFDQLRQVVPGELRYQVRPDLTWRFRRDTSIRASCGVYPKDIVTLPPQSGLIVTLRGINYDRTSGV